MAEQSPRPDDHTAERIERAFRSDRENHPRSARPGDQLIPLQFFSLAQPGGATEEQLDEVIALVRAKEQSPQTISFASLCDGVNRILRWRGYSSAWLMTESGQVTNRVFWDFLVSLGDSGYLLKYESFIEGELRRLESYLGFRLSARREVGEYERTRRSASREIGGNFAPRKTWSFFAPTFGRSFMRPPGSQQMSRHMLHHLQEGLGLTEAQMKQV